MHSLGFNTLGNFKRSLNKRQMPGAQKIIKDGGL